MGASTPRERVDILTAHRVRVDEKQRRLAEARSALDTKISHYENLIAQGLDCDGLAITSDSSNEHRSVHGDSHT